MSVTKLSHCKPGQTGVIKNIAGDGPVIQRLLELGLIEGKAIRVLRHAPFGDPISIEFEGMHLALRAAEAQHLEILL
ncbi:MAG: FeoA family protein [Planctomycetota bacterium]|nr:FeoA family protein [Planctomycetota bacterium]